MFDFDEATVYVAYSFRLNALDITDEAVSSRTR